jgi:hypothetical protein
VRPWFIAVAVLLFVSATFTRVASAQPTEALAERPVRAVTEGAERSEYSVYVLTFGPGDHPFTKFGHNAIWIRDHRRHEDRVYNFGTFRMSDTIIADFLQGRLIYWLSVTDLARALAVYKRENRSVVAQELRLDRAQKRDLANRLRENARPENAAYKYDYYLDNCSTRVRDVLDSVTGGALRRAAEAPAEWTFRQHTLRLTRGDVLLALGLDAGLGQRVDEPVDRFAEMFLPGVVHDVLNVTKVGSSGHEEPLVKETTVLHRAHRPVEPQKPPRWWPDSLAVGSLVGGGLWFFVRKARSTKEVRVQRAARAAVWTVAAVFGLVLGVLGCLLTFFWVATDHAIAQRNENLLQLSPLAISLVPLAAWAASSKRADRSGAFVALGLALSASLGLLGKALPVFTQNNAVFVALCVPLWWGLALAFRELVRFGASERGHVDSAGSAHGQEQ